MLTAVIEARAVPLSGRDIFPNGWRLHHETALTSVGSAHLVSDGPASPKRTVFFGEVALSAELRQVAQSDARLKEAAKLALQCRCLGRAKPVPNMPKSLVTSRHWLI